MAQRSSEGIPLGVSNLRAPRGQHVCFLFSDEEERFRTLARYYQAGAQGGDKLLYITDTSSPEEVRARFAALGVDFCSARCAAVRSAAELIHPEGRFVPEAAIDALTELCLEALDEGFDGMRCSGEMSWAARGVPGADRLLEYEVMLNALFDGGDGVPLTGACQYDTRLFDGKTIQMLLEIHPYLLVNGQIVRNPNHVPSETLMGRLRTAAA